MKTFWASWYSGDYEDEGCTKPPFEYWISGQCSRPNEGLTPELYAQYEQLETEEETDAFLDEHARCDCTICALIVIESEAELWGLVAKHFPDYKYRFLEERPEGWKPGSRFT